MKKILLVALTTIMVCFASCKKEENSNGSSDSKLSLVNTSWENEETEYLGSLPITLTQILNFTTETEGNIVSAFDMAGETDSETANFTYTFDGETGIIYRTDVEGNSMITINDDTHLTLETLGEKTVFTKID